MNNKVKNQGGVDEYIGTFPNEVQKKLKKFRELISKLAPKSEETISYGMPTFKVNSKNLVHFAAFEKHIGFYPTPSAIAKFQKDLLKYKTSKGAVQFRMESELPLKLIEKIVKFRLGELALKK